jgi:hypothetical protein
MDESQNEESPMNDKKVWTQPVIQAIQLNEAKHQTSSGNDSSGGHTKS